MVVKDLVDVCNKNTWITLFLDGAKVYEEIVIKFTNCYNDFIVAEEGYEFIVEIKKSEF